MSASNIKYYPDVLQGSELWFQLRTGILTASEMKNVINHNLEPVKPTKKDAERGKDIRHLYDMLAQRITNYTEPSYISDDMLRGKEDEIHAKIAYSANYAPIQDMGFITNDKWGFTIGFSPDGLVGDDGLVEGKSRKYKYQIETILDNSMPSDFLVQVQTGLMVSERKWCDFISYPAYGGTEMLTVRVEADKNAQDAIIAAAFDFERRLAEKLKQYNDIVASGKARLIKTERRVAETLMEGETV